MGKKKYNGSYELPVASEMKVASPGLFTGN